MMEKNYCVFTDGERVRAHLSKEGIDSECIDFDCEKNIENIRKAACNKVVIIIGGRPRIVKRIGHELTNLGIMTYCYTTDVCNNEMRDKPLSAIINRDDANRIELVAKRFSLTPCDFWL